MLLKLITILAFLNVPRATLTAQSLQLPYEPAARIVPQASPLTESSFSYLYGIKVPSLSWTYQKLDIKEPIPTTPSSYFTEIFTFFNTSIMSNNYFQHYFSLDSILNMSCFHYIFGGRMAAKQPPPNLYEIAIIAPPQQSEHLDRGLVERMLIAVSNSAQELIEEYKRAYSSVSGLMRGLYHDGLMRGLYHDGGMGTVQKGASQIIPAVGMVIAVWCLLKNKQ